MDNISISEIPDNSKDQRYLLNVKGRTFYVGDILGVIILGLTNEKTISEITEDINNHVEFRERNLTKEQVELIIQEKIKPILNSVVEESNNSINRKTSYISGIRLKKDILRFKHIKPFLNFTRYLFNPYVFFPILGIALALNIFYMHNLMAASHEISLYASQKTDCGGLTYLLYFYPFAFIILFSHEIGHASAAYYFNITPKTIGLGFYFLFPVLYTDVTDTWRLTRYKRVIVDAAGIYIQLLLNLVLILIIYQQNDLDIILITRYIIILNISTIIINCIPFIQFDGYWAYSDVFKLPNLKHQSNAYWVLVLKKIFPALPLGINENIKRILNPKSLPLILFFIGKQLFLIFFLYVSFKIVVKAVETTYTIFLQLIDQQITYCNMQLLVRSLMILSIVIYYTVRNYKSIKPLVVARIKSRAKVDKLIN